jgi:hypothetical protein
MVKLSFLIVSIQMLSISHSFLLYIDPGTGSIIVQALVATAVGAAISLKLYWHRLLKFFGLRKTTKPDLSTKADETVKQKIDKG